MSTNNDVTFFGVKETVLSFKEFRCMVVSAWTSEHPQHLTMALTKGSPLAPVFNYQLLKLKELGGFELLKQRWQEGLSTQCRTEQDIREEDDDIFKPEHTFLSRVRDGGCV